MTDAPRSVVDFKSCFVVEPVNEEAGIPVVEPPGYDEAYQAALRSDVVGPVYLTCVRRWDVAWPGHYPEHTRRDARQHVAGMVRRGELPPQQERACAECGVPGRVRLPDRDGRRRWRFNAWIEYHHHRGYDRDHWGDVLPLCSPCHVREHVRLRRGWWERIVLTGAAASKALRWHEPGSSGA
jgi:hypothetical protein